MALDQGINKVVKVYPEGNDDEENVKKTKVHRDPLKTVNVTSVALKEEAENHQSHFDCLSLGTAND